MVGQLAGESLCHIRSRRKELDSQIRSSEGRAGHPHRTIVEHGCDFYFYESPDIPATRTVMRHLDEIERLILDAQGLFAVAGQEISDQRTRKVD
jgi:hypothetical protein